MAARILLALLLWAALLAPGCGDGTTSPEGYVPRDLTAAEQQVVQSENVFGLSLFRTVADAAAPDENVFVSPFSVSMALGMTANGAAGTTLQAMLNTLGFSGLGMHDVNASYLGLMDLLPGLDPDVAFNVANSIWYRQGYSFNQSFFDTCTAYFDAAVREIDFDGMSAVDTINAWVSEKTRGKIEEILEPPIGGDVVMYLINAIYFLANWEYEFDPALTEEAPFYLPDGSTVSVSLMRQPAEDEESVYMCYSNSSFQAVDLPYGNGLYSMTVLLPRPGVDIDSLIGEFSPENWETYMAGFEEKEGRIFLPKFEIECKYLLNNALISMGMGIAFDWSLADFTGMRPEGGLWISRVIHKTYVKVDEEGTEAAAVTVVEMIETEFNSFEMRVDRPFIFAIRESHSGTILFMGKIVNPVPGD
jgi:serine protease inhibitor